MIQLDISQFNKYFVLNRNLFDIHYADFLHFSQRFLQIVAPYSITISPQQHRKTHNPGFQISDRYQIDRRLHDIYLISISLKKSDYL
jgi:hypothetical protein